VWKTIRIGALMTSKLTGGSSDYYKIVVNDVTIECNDVIKALKLNYALGNILKAVWRIAQAHQGRGKPGTTTIYDAEKIVFFGEDQLDEEKKAEDQTTQIPESLFGSDYDLWPFRTKDDSTKEPHPALSGSQRVQR